MTGYGKQEMILSTHRITAEIRSLNSKQLDLSTRVHPAFKAHEMTIRSLVSPLLVRGKVELSVQLEPLTSGGLSLNMDVLENYHIQLRELCQRLGTEMPSDPLIHILRMPEVLTSAAHTVELPEWDVLQGVVKGAVSELQEFRRREGEMLSKVLEGAVEAIRTLLLQTEPYEQERIDRIRTRINDALQTLPAQAIDPSRLEQEMIFYIEKLDVHEEKSRLLHHIDYFLQTLHNEPNAGKKLGFIAQEMGREINTLGSKSNHAQMQRIVVLMKDNLEQIKEQVLNVL